MSKADITVISFLLEISHVIYYLTTQGSQDKCRPKTPYVDEHELFCISAIDIVGSLTHYNSTNVQLGYHSSVTLTAVISFNIT